MLTIFQKGPGKGRRQAEFEVRVGADLHQLPLRKLPLEEKPKTLPEDQPAALSAEVRARLPAKIDQVELTFPLGEPLDGQLESSLRRLLQSRHTPRDTPRP